MDLLTTVPTKTYEIALQSFSWKESPSVKSLLNAVAHIIADEFTATAKEHPEVFASGKE